MAKINHGVVVVLVPLPMQGHLNQLLHLSRLLLANNIPVHFVGTSIHNRQARVRVQGWNPASFPNLIHFHDLSVPSFPSPLPDRNTRFPSHLQPSFEATLHLRNPLAALLRRLSRCARRVVVIHDSLMASVVQDFASLPNAESYIFHSISAFAMFLYFWESMGKPPLLSDVLLPPIDIPSLDGCFSAEFLDFIASQHHCHGLKSGCLFNTSRVIEKRFMDLLDGIMITPTKKNWAIGPFNPVCSTIDNGVRHPCLKWLDRQPPRSVIYVCFGTTTALSEEQIREMGVGLEKSRQRFIWVVREADRGDVFDVGGDEGRRTEVPKGYEERVKNVGMVVRDWAPQLEILGHPSTGGFMSHCGWNSCMESITMGKPIAAWPMHSDQPRNTLLITKFLKIGCAVRDWTTHTQNDVVSAALVENGVTKLMSSREGDEMRKRASELGAAVRLSMAQGGSSRLEFDSFISHITR